MQRRQGQHGRATCGKGATQRNRVTCGKGVTHSKGGHKGDVTRQHAAVGWWVTKGPAGQHVDDTGCKKRKLSANERGKEKKWTRWQWWAPHIREQKGTPGTDPWKRGTTPPSHLPERGVPCTCTSGKSEFDFLSDFFCPFLPWSDLIDSKSV